MRVLCSCDMHVTSYVLRSHAYIQDRLTSMWYCVHMLVCLNSLMYVVHAFIHLLRWAIPLSSSNTNTVIMCVCVPLFPYSCDIHQWLQSEESWSRQQQLMNSNRPRNCKAKHSFSMCHTSWRKYLDHTTLVPTVSRSKSVCTLVLFHIQFWSNLNAQYDMPYVWTMNCTHLFIICAWIHCA